MQWFKHSQIVLLVMVFMLGCQMTGESGSSSVWRRGERSSITAPLKKTPSKEKEVETEERLIPEQPKPKPPEREEKPVPVKPDEEPEREIVKEPDEEQPITRPEKAPEDPGRTPERSPESEKPAIREFVAAEESLMAEITGLVIEQTMTRIGYDFYEYFYIHWTPPQLTEIEDYNIYIHERASPLWGSWVWVTVNDRIIWQKVLRPRAAETEDAAKLAIKVTTNYLTNFDEYAMGSEDVTGTGI